MSMHRQSGNWASRLAGVAVLMLALGSSLPATAQIARDNQLMIELLNRIERLERELRELRGDLDLYRHQQETLEQRLQNLDSGTHSGQGLEGAPADADTVETESPPATTTGTGSSPATGSRPPATITPAPVAPAAPVAPPPSAAPPPVATARPLQPLTPEAKAAYDDAIDHLRTGYYEQAANEFRAFLDNYPHSELTDDAQYWLGEVHYVSRDFDQAKEAFIALGVNYPDSNRLPDAMLKLANIYEEGSDKAKARELLQKLVQSYPDTQAGRVAKRRLQGSP